MIDFIGDIHGHADELEKLLTNLGYVKKDGVYQHKNRTVVFIGDYIDRGPKIRETLAIVKQMVDKGSAIALMGNHEYNAICYNYRNTSGRFLREHNEKNNKQHEETLNQFKAYPEEYSAYISWFLTLPLFLEGKGFNAIHACWDHNSVAYLKKRLISNVLSEDLLVDSCDRSNELFDCLETILKGKEMEIPNWSFIDKDGHRRSEIRNKWWVDGRDKTYTHMSILDCQDLPDRKLPLNDANNHYGRDQKPVFFGHYWLTGEPRLPESNVCCLDYSVARSGKLVSYRWDGEKELSEANFEWVFTGAD